MLKGGLILDRKAKVKGDRARPAVLLTGDESYDTKTYEELLLRAAETLLGPVRPARHQAPALAREPLSEPLEPQPLGMPKDGNASKSRSQI